MTWNDISRSKNALLTTYKKDGTPVGTPVWVAPDGDRIVVWTKPDSWKVKRMRRNPEVTLQVCDNRGRVQDGDVVTGKAEVLDAEGTEQVRRIVAKKYGVIGKVGIWGHKVIKGADGSVGIAIVPR